MKIILNRHDSAMSFKHAIQTLAEGSSGLSLAVSYLQVGGWELLRANMRGISPQEVRIVCTDQMGITQPEAVRRALAHRVQIHNYIGEHTYHPKVYLSYGEQGRPRRFLVSSANLSYSAFHHGVEAGVLGDDRKALRTLHEWFEDLFNRQSTAVSDQQLAVMADRWRRAASARVRAQLRRRAATPVPQPEITVAPTVADVDVIEDIFATIQLPIGLLNFDHARNNIRNLGHLRRVLSQWDTIRTASSGAAGKQRSELRLLGLIDNQELTPVGQRAAQARDDDELARTWCHWIRSADEAQLQEVNPRLLAFKRVMRQFWRLKAEVREFFLNNAANRADRTVLQTIELLCNASDIVQELSLENFEALAPLLSQVDRLPSYVRDAIAEYKDNKGMRGWDYPDRIIMPRAWAAVEEGGRT